MFTSDHLPFQLLVLLNTVYFHPSSGSVHMWLILSSFFWSAYQKIVSFSCNPKPTLQLTIFLCPRTNEGWGEHIAWSAFWDTKLRAAIFSCYFVVPCFSTPRAEMVRFSLVSLFVWWVGICESIYFWWHTHCFLCYASNSKSVLILWKTK